MPRQVAKTRRCRSRPTWAKLLELDQRLIEQRPNETHAAWRQRTQHQWGLLEWVRESCTYLHGTRLAGGVNRLLIESAGPGLPAQIELANRYPELGGIIVPRTVKHDKVARALRVQPTCSQGLVYAPDKTWSDMVITEMETFPKSKYDDLTDSATQALSYLRNVGLASTDHEEHYATLQTVMHKPRLKPLYPC
jgi:hypothetical protein